MEKKSIKEKCWDELFDFFCGEERDGVAWERGNQVSVTSSYLPEDCVSLWIKLEKAGEVH